MARKAPRVWVDATPANGWYEHPLQDQAFAFADEANADRDDPEQRLHVWALELDASGRRKYFCASRADFWRRYRTLRSDAPSADGPPPSCFRHYYEVIREGAPCHLHLDLEFATASNPRHSALRTRLALAPPPG